MTEHEKQTEFLWTLMHSHDCEECHQLWVRIASAERDERCIRSAITLAFLVGLFSILGLAYSAVFLSDFFQNSTPVTVKAFEAIFVASGISLLAFLGLWSWYRGICNALYNQSREFIISRQTAGPKPLPAAVVTAAPVLTAQQAEFAATSPG